MRVTREAFDLARAQAAPHKIDVMEVTAHAECHAKGCPDCGNSGVVHRDTGKPFMSATAANSGTAARAVPPTPPATTRQISEQRQRAQEIKAAIGRMELLRNQFRMLADLLTRSASSATELAAELDRILAKR